MATLVVGIGNPWASDDGVGQEVVRRLEALAEAQSRDGGQAPATFSTTAQPDVALLDALENCDTAIIVDAVSSGAGPGTVHRRLWEPGTLDGRGVERTSSHGFGVRELLDLALALDQLPERVILWGIETGSREPGQGLSAEVAAVVPAVVKELWDELMSMAQASHALTGRRDL
jgi:hydrogenase maturation protease